MTKVSGLIKPGDIVTRETNAHVQVFSESGAQLADSRSPIELDEFHCPTRFYFSPDEVDMDHLESVDLETECPYKGVCNQYWAVDGDKERKPIAWTYREPIDSVKDIKDRIAFWNERVTILINGFEWKKDQSY